MKKLALWFGVLLISCETTWAGISVGTSQPAGNPLIMSAGGTSGPMLVTVSSDNPGQDIMSAWMVDLEISPMAGASGTLSFQDPATGAAADPANYVFGNDGYGIAATNTGSTLTANDFFVSGNLLGALVSDGTLLQIDFQASATASGLFGIYAVEGAGATAWTDGDANTQFFSNVPAGTDSVLIGEVLISGQAVPEPTSGILFGIPAFASVLFCLYRRNKPLSE